MLPGISLDSINSMLKSIKASMDSLGEEVFAMGETLESLSASILTKEMT